MALFGVEFCPECGCQLIHQEGCSLCPCCGYSECGGCGVLTELSGEEGENKNVDIKR
jgi:uncharacterized Zn finger protein (UPF0148 family)